MPTRLLAQLQLPVTRLLRLDTYHYIPAISKPTPDPQGRTRAAGRSNPIATPHFRSANKPASESLQLQVSRALLLRFPEVGIRHQTAWQACNECGVYYEPVSRAMSRNKALAMLQKTYDDSYLSCSTAVYHESQVGPSPCTSSLPSRHLVATSTASDGDSSMPLYTNTPVANGSPWLRM